MVSSVFALPPAYAQSADVQWIKERVSRMHARYTGQSDHDHILYKLQGAQEKVTSPEVHRALTQIITWWEELRPTTVRS